MENYPKVMNRTEQQTLAGLFNWRLRRPRLLLEEKLSSQGLMICTALRTVMIYQACSLDKKEVTFGRQKLLLFCERAVKRCINVGKNSKKYTGKLLDQLEVVYLESKISTNTYAVTIKPRLFDVTFQ